MIVEKIRGTPFIYLVITDCFISAISTGGKTAPAPSLSPPAVFGQIIAFYGPALWMIWEFLSSASEGAVRKGECESGDNFLHPPKPPAGIFSPIREANAPMRSPFAPMDKPCTPIQTSFAPIRQSTGSRGKSEAGLKSSRGRGRFP